MSKLSVKDTCIAGVSVVTRTRFADDRGSFERLFDHGSLGGLLGAGVRQLNRAVTSRAGTVRGMHLQVPPSDEAKLVTCIRGRVFDVALDLRRSSPTFGEWFGLELSEGNLQAMLIPAGCAHGMQALEDDCELIYAHSAEYRPEHELGLDPRDASVAIRWPLPPSNLSPRDASNGISLADFLEVSW